MNATSDNLRHVPVNISMSLINKGPVFIESGTTDTYFISELEQPFKAAWNQLVGWEYTNQPTALTYEEMIKLPVIVIQFQGSQDLNDEVGDPNQVPNLAGELDGENPYDVVIAVPPHHYMEQDGDGSSGTYTPRFYMEEPLWGGSTIGANLIMGHDVLFDMKNRRIGWAESNCNYEHLVEAAGYGRNNQPNPVPTPATPAPPPVTPATPPVEPPAPNGPKNGASVPTPDASNKGGGFCSSSLCRFWGTLVVISLMVGVLFLQRSDSSILNRLTGRRSRYTTMATQEGEPELELQLAYRPEFT